MTAGYSGTPLPKKLGIKEGHTVAFLHAPADFTKTLGKLPADVIVKKQLRGPLDVIVYFTDDKHRRVSTGFCLQLVKPESPDCGSSTG